MTLFHVRHRMSLFIFAFSLVSILFTGQSISQTDLKNRATFQQSFLVSIQSCGKSSDYKGKNTDRYYLKKDKGIYGLETIYVSLMAKFKDTQKAKQMILSNSGTILCMNENGIYFVVPLDNISRLTSYDNFASPAFPIIPRYPNLSTSRKDLNIDILENMNVIRAGSPTTDKNRGKGVKRPATPPY